jgi:hypothetical protein
MYVPTTTGTSLSSSPSPFTYGQPITLTAVVTSPLGTPPDGHGDFHERQNSPGYEHS